MSKDDIEREIRSRKDSTNSVDEQIDIAHAMWDEDIGPEHDGFKSKNIEDELDLDLDYGVKTSLGHLVDIDLVDEYLPPGVSTFVIATWMDEDDAIVNGSVDEAAEEAIEALIDDMDDLPGTTGTDGAAVADGGGTTIRSVVADRFDLAPDAVEDYLRDSDDQVDRLNGAVEAIEDEEDVEAGDDYGEIIFVNRAYRYRLTERAVGLYEQ